MKYLPHVFVTVLLTFSFIKSAESQDLSNAFSLGGPDNDSINDIVTDSDGNIFVVGHFSETAIFAEGTPEETSLVSAGITDVFVAKYVHSGQLDWVFRDGDERVEQGFSIALGNDGSVYVAGLYADSSLFGRGQINETLLIADSDHNGFVAKYDVNGLLDWVKRVGSNQARGVVVDNEGSVYVSGFMGGTATFGEGELNEQDFVGDPASVDGFVAKYNNSGAFQWVTGLTGTGFESIYSIAVDEDANIIAVGVFSDGAVIGTNGPTEITLDSSGGSDGFTASFDSAGTLLWTKSFGGIEDDAAFGVDVSMDGSIVVAGEFGEDGTFGADESGETTLSSAGMSDIFVANFSDNGTLGWVRAAGGAGNDRASDLDVLRGTIAVTGNFAGTATFGIGESTETVLTSAGISDIFAAKYDTSGMLVWSKRNGSFSNNEFAEFGISATIDPFENVLFSGFFQGSTVFGSGEPGQTTLIGNGDSDGFVAKYGDAHPTSVDSNHPEDSRIVLSNFPNPFRTQTTTRFFIPQSAIVTIDIFDSIGRLVSTSGIAHYSVGWHDEQFDLDELGSGIYLVRLSSQHQTVSTAIVKGR